MSINGLGSTAYGQMSQALPQKSGGQVIQQQATVVQGPSEEGKESATQKNQESMQKTESMESKSGINLYA
ncbi:MAG: hypothetical protein JZU50_14335 [Desulfobulbaceae bacterium]|jgi:hypothetical protein|nr:hypothetical protein [Desulfobulbaceae bacterium]